MGHYCLCFIVLQVCPYLVCLHVSLGGLYIPCFINKFEALVQGHMEIPGRECHGLEIWVMENMTGFLCSRQKQ